MSSVTIRLARLEEQHDLTELQRRASLMWDDVRDQLLAMPHLIIVPETMIAAGQVLVAERDGPALGCASFLPRDDGDTELDGLFVEPSCWREGIGTILVRAVENEATAQGARYLHVLGNRNVRGFYAACGFETVGEKTTLLGPVGLLMVKRLA